MKGSDLAIIGGAVTVIALWIGFWGTVAWIAWHFISKFW